ncbi:hypothetical protein [Nitrosospira sp. Nsp18]|uniref:hypothetical protein n=1 Tax=Nitrosospira sp. Nsp18 TaxID=1855334 RepID=UPI00115F7C82|nr:hypothetical protein [Nitrosospira sp. Nsp18]
MKTVQLVLLRAHQKGKVRGIQRLWIDCSLKRICGFPKWKSLPDESSFSRAPGFAEAKLTERVHEALIKEHLATVLTGYMDPNGTAVEVSEKPVKTPLAHTPLLNW